MAVATDNFNRADGALGSNWFSPIEKGAGVGGVAPGTMKIATNQVGAIVDDQHSFGYYSGAIFTNDQYAQVKIVTIGAWVGACVRASVGVERFYYGFVFGANDYRLFRFWDNVHQSLATGSALTWVANDILKVSISGNAHPFTLNMYRNSVLALTWTSASSADVKNGGSPGVGIYSPAGQNLRLDDWEGGSVATAAVSVTDSFTRANGSLGTNWTPAFYSQSNFAIVSNTARATGDSLFHLAFWSAATFNDDQYAQFTVGSLVNLAGSGVILRADAAADKCYVILIDSTTSFKIYARWLGAFNVLTTLGSLPTLAVGNVIRAQVSGSTHPFTISIIVNGTWVGGWTSTDNTYARTGGSPGIITFQSPGSTQIIDDFAGGDLTGIESLVVPPSGLTSASLGMLGQYQKHFA